MKNVQPKSVSRFDDDTDFAASFVLGRHEVEEALAAASENGAAQSESKPAASRNMKPLYGAAAVAAVAVLLVAVFLWLSV